MLSGDRGPEEEGDSGMASGEGIRYASVDGAYVQRMNMPSPAEGDMSSVDRPYGMLQGDPFHPGRGRKVPDNGRSSCSIRKL